MITFLTRCKCQYFVKLAPIYVLWEIFEVTFFRSICLKQTQYETIQTNQNEKYCFVFLSIRLFTANVYSVV